MKKAISILMVLLMGIVMIFAEQNSIFQPLKV